MESELERRLGKALRKLGHDCKGPTINLKMALEILPDLDSQHQGAFISEMTQSVNQLSTLLDESFLLAQVPYWELEPTNFSGVMQQFADSLDEHSTNLFSWSLQAHFNPRVDLDGHRFIKLLNWWLRLHQANATIKAEPTADGKNCHLSFSRPNSGNTESQHNLLLAFEALANRCGGRNTINGEISLLLPLR